MSDDAFREEIYRYAAYLKAAPLTADERARIIEEFNRLTGDPDTRAQEAIRSVLGIGRVIEEFRKSANQDNTQRLLQDLQAAADKWQASK